MTHSSKFQNPVLSGTGIVRAVTQKSEVIAIGSTFRLLTQPRARAAYAGQSLKHRVALYSKKSTTPFAWYDGLKFPINHIAFHPTQSVIAIATGSYDGGYTFEGELVVWNYETGEVSHEMAETPEVFSVAFSDDGMGIICIVRPWDENEFEHGDKIFDMFYEVRLAYTQTLELGIVNAKAVYKQMMAQKPLTEKQVNSDPRFSFERSPTRTIQKYFMSDNLKMRSPIWDIAILKNDDIAIVHDDTFLDVFDRQGTAIHSFKGEGHGVQIIKSDKTIVHVINPNNQVRDWTSLDTKLFQFDGATFSEKLHIDGIFTFSKSSGGVIIGRRDRSGAEGQLTDIATDTSLETITDHDFGHYDVFNHFIRVDEAPFNLILQGNPPNSHTYKRVAKVDDDLNVTPLWPIISDNIPTQDQISEIKSDPYNPLLLVNNGGTFETHAMECFFTYVSDDQGEGIIGSGRYYDPKPNAKRKGFMYRKSVSDGKELWSHEVAAACSVMKQIPNLPVVIAAFLDGTMIVIRTDSGKILHETSFKLNGLPNVVFSLDCSRNKVVIGTLTGEVALIEIDRILESGIGNVSLS